MSNPIGNTAIYGGLDADGSNAKIGVSAGVAATGVLTITGATVAGETVTIGPFKYTFVSALSSPVVALQVIAQSTATASAVALKEAINASATGDGTDYSFGTVPHPLVSANNSSGVLTVTALSTGGDSNLIATTETLSNGSWGSTTLTGGTFGGLEVTVSSTSPIPVIPGGVFTGTEVSVAASGSSTIPTSAVQWTVLYFGTGTANTFGSSTAIVAPCAISGTGKPTVAIAVAADSSSSAVIIYSTT